MDSDDDVPPPTAPQPQPKKTVIHLDDSDDDGLPPPSSFSKAPPAAAASPAAAPKQKMVVNLDDDDETPPPPAPAPAPATAAKQRPSIVTQNSSPASPDMPPAPAPTPATPAAAVAAPKPTQQQQQHVDAAPSTPSAGNSTVGPMSPASPAAGQSAVGLARPRGLTSSKKIHFEGFLFKQQPTWPYSSQKRYCILDGRTFSYYESKEELSRPSGTLDLKGAQLNLEPGQAAKMPNSFGIAMNVDPHAVEGLAARVLSFGADSSANKTRTYIFSTVNKDDFDAWTAVIQSVVSGRRAQEIHWFEKMAQGIF